MNPGGLGMGFGKQNRRVLFQIKVAEGLVRMLQKYLLHLVIASISFVERVNTSTSARRSSGRLASTIYGDRDRRMVTPLLQRRQTLL